MIPLSPVRTRTNALGIEWLEKMDNFTGALASFRRFNGARMREWELVDDGREVVIEMASVLSEADSLSRLVDSIVDGTEEDVPMDELVERFVRLLMKADALAGRWRALVVGREM